MAIDTSRPQPPSAWVQRWSHQVPAGASVLDLACGAGRHTRWFAERGARVTALDRNGPLIEPLGGIAEIIVADIETGPWPLAGRSFDAIVVTHYLWRALLPTLVASLAPGGVLIYETFAQGNAAFGKPSNPDFLLRPGELLEAASGLRVIAYEDGFLDAPPRCIQRIAAVRADASAAPIPRYRL